MPNENDNKLVTLADLAVAYNALSDRDVMTSEDKLKLDGIQAGAQVNTVLGIRGAAESAGVYRTGNVELTPANIGAMPSRVGSLDFHPASDATNGGYIDFNFEDSDPDFTSRIMETANGVISIRRPGETYYPIVTTKEMSAVTTPTIGRSDYISAVSGGYVVCGRMVNFNISFTMLTGINQSLTNAIINMPTSNYYGKYLCSSSGADTSTTRIAILANGNIHIYGSFAAGTTYYVCGGYLKY